jgi:hypothetical protein
LSTFLVVIGNACDHTCPSRLTFEHPAPGAARLRSHTEYAWRMLEDAQCISNAPVSSDPAAAFAEATETILRVYCPEPCPEDQRGRILREQTIPLAMAMATEGTTRCEFEGMDRLVLNMRDDVMSVLSETSRLWYIPLATGGTTMGCFQAASWEREWRGQHYAAILVNAGLFRAADTFSRILIYSMSYDPDAGQVAELDGDPAHVEQTLNVDPNLAAQAATAALIFFDPEVPEDVPAHRDDVAMHMTVALYGGAERFAIAHEMAHIDLGHTAECARNQLQIAGQEGGTLGVDVRAADQEYAADIRGLELFGSTVISDQERELGVYGPIVLLGSLAIIEDFGEQLFGWHSSTHPPARERLARILSSELYMRDELRERAAIFTSVMDSIRGHLHRRLEQNPSLRAALAAEITPTCVSGSRIQQGVTP